MKSTARSFSVSPINSTNVENHRRQTPHSYHPDAQSTVYGYDRAAQPGKPLPFIYERKNTGHPLRSKRQVRATLVKSSFARTIGEENICSNIHEALKRAEVCLKS